MMLEESIDEQIDKQIEIKQKAAKARKQISRTMKKTETYLVDVERLLREKLSGLQSQEIEDRRLKSERQIVDAKKSEALKATIKGENQRINMRMHFERDQAQRDQEKLLQDQIRDGRRQCVEVLGNEVQMLSTRVLVKEGQLAHTLMEQESHMKQVLRQLESTQASLLRAYQVKENQEARRAIQISQGGVKGRVNDAVANLTMFSKEAADDVREIKYKLEMTSNELNERERETRKQEVILKDIRSELAVSERKMESYEQKTKVLRDQCQAHAIDDFGTQETAVKKKIIEKETQIKRLMHKV